MNITRFGRQPLSAAALATARSALPLPLRLVPIFDIHHAQAPAPDFAAAARAVCCLELRA